MHSTISKAQNDHKNLDTYHVKKKQTQQSWKQFLAIH